MTDREIAQAIRRADADALRHQLEDGTIVLCEAGIASISCSGRPGMQISSRSLEQIMLIWSASAIPVRA